MPACVRRRLWTPDRPARFRPYVSGQIALVAKDGTTLRFEREGQLGTPKGTSNAANSDDSRGDYRGAFIVNYWLTIKRDPTEN
jgi:hypothetical protein